MHRFWQGAGLAGALCLCAGACGDDNDGGSSATDSGDSSTCPMGSERCPCTPGGGCDPGLECRSGVCVDADDTSDDGGAGDDGGTGGDDGGAGDDGGSGTGSGGGSSGGGGTGEPELDDWTKRRPISITNAEAVTLTDYQVFVPIEYDSDMNEDFSDLRFTDESGSRLLPYWIESSVTPVDADIWIRVPSVAAEGVTTIYMYYGNPAATTSASDGDATFIFFDGFDGSTLDETKWGATAAYGVEFGHLTVTTGAVYTNTTVASQPSTLVESRVAWLNDLDKARGAIDVSAAQGHGDTMMPVITTVYRDNTRELNAFAYDPDPVVEWGELWGVEIGPLYTVGMAIDDTTFYYDLNGGARRTFEGSWTAPYYIRLGHGWGSAAGINDSRDMQFDWVRVRAFTPVEPGILVGGEEDA